MPRKALPKAPELRDSMLRGLPAPAAIYLREHARWSRDMQTILEQSLGEQQDALFQPGLPLALPTLLLGELAGTRLRPGGPPALAAVPDAVGGLALAMRDGTTWNYINDRDTVISLGANATGLTAATLTDIAGLSAPVAAASGYAVRICIRVATDNVAHGFGFGYTATGVVATVNFNVRFPGQSANDAVADATYFKSCRLKASSTIVSVAGFSTTSGTWSVEASGLLFTTNAGTFQIQGTNPAAAGTVTPQAGSYLVLTRVT